MSRCCLLLVALSVIAAPTALIADDYELAAGESDTLSTAATYDTMTVNGDLTVTGGITIKSPTINMAGGSITVTGADTTLGVSSSGEDNKTTLSMTNGADGAYGILRSIGGGVAADDGLAFYRLNIQKEGPDFTSDNGYFDFVSISNGTANLYCVYNYSSCTGRITVAGSSAIYRRQQRQNYGIFRSGAYKIDMKDAATLTFNFSAQGGYLNAAGCCVDIGGSGVVRFVGSYQSTSYSADINEGAFLNHTGSVAFVRADNDRHCYFALNDSNVIGPNVTALKQTSGSSSYNTQISIASGKTITLCGDVEITGTRAYLTGGRIKIDATDAARSFKCHINANDSLVVEKVGANEMVLSSTTNIPNLVVGEGFVRIKSDCVIERLTISGGGVIADGCVVTLPSGGEYVGASFLTANGGVFVKSDSARTVIYDPVSVTGALHIANGELAFSKYGFGQKWWRWTFKEVYGGPKAYIAGRFFLFGTNGGRVCDFNSSIDPTSPSTSDDASGMMVGRVRFKHNAATNITVAASAKSYQTVSYLRNCFRSATYTDNLNNFPYLSSPIVDPNNSASWISVDARLTAGASRLTGYNMAISLANRYATAWTVEASSDGKVWETIETRSNVTHAHPGNAYYYYDGYYPSAGKKPSEHFHFTGYRNGGLAAMDPLSVQVDDGATLDLLAFDDGQPVDSITIDLAAGGGTLKGGKIMPNGVLNIENATGAALSEPLPLVLEDALDTANFASWSVVVNGRRRKASIICEGNRLRVQLAGLAVFLQ